MLAHIVRSDALDEDAMEEVLGLVKLSLVIHVVFNIVQLPFFGCPNSIHTLMLAVRN